MFELIGMGTTGYFIYKGVRLVMNRELFFDEVRKLRGYISYEYPHKILDNIVETATGGTEMKERSLEEDMKRLIKRIEEAKKDEKLSDKAKELIKKIKAELE